MNVELTKDPSSHNFLSRYVKHARS
jgi:hypothetical protein